MRRRKAPERFFRAPPQEILDTIRELTLTNIEKRLDQFPERLNYFINAGDEEESKRKDIALQKVRPSSLSFALALYLSPVPFRT
jgi:hypothetical protein